MPVGLHSRGQCCVCPCEDLNLACDCQGVASAARLPDCRSATPHMPLWLIPDRRPRDLSLQGNASSCMPQCGLAQWNASLTCMVALAVHHWAYDQGDELMGHSTSAEQRRPPVLFLLGRLHSDNQLMLCLSVCGLARLTAVLPPAAV